MSPCATFTAGISEIRSFPLICDTDNSFNDNMKRTLFYKAKNTDEDPPGYKKEGPESCRKSC